MHGINFAIIVKFIHLRLFFYIERTFQLPNSSIKRPPLSFSITFRLPSRAEPFRPVPLPFLLLTDLSQSTPTALSCRSPLPSLIVPSHKLKSLLPSAPTIRFSFPTMVRTCGGHRSRPRGQTSTPARDGACISRVAVGHSPAQNIEAPPALTPATALMQSPTSTAIPKEPQGSELPSRRYHTRVGPLPPLLCIHDHLGGPRLPSGPEHLA